MTEKPAEHTKTEPKATDKTTEAPAPPKPPFTDDSPVKTHLTPPPGHRSAAAKPRTVAEHNAYVDLMSRKTYPPVTQP